MRGSAPPTWGICFALQNVGVIPPPPPPVTKLVQLPGFSPAGTVTLPHPFLGKWGEVRGWTGSSRTLKKKNFSNLDWLLCQAGKERQEPEREKQGGGGDSFLHQTHFVGVLPGTGAAALPLAPSPSANGREKQPAYADVYSTYHPWSLHHPDQSGALLSC